MKFIFTFRGLNSSDAIKQYAEKKFKKLEKYFYGEVEAHVIFKREKFREIVEVNIVGDGERIITKEETQDIYEAIDLAYESLEKQVKKMKEKRMSFRKERTPEVLEEQPEKEFILETMEVNPMSTQEAIDWFRNNQKEKFMLFFNTDYNTICLVYKKGDTPVVVIPEMG